MNTGTIFFRNLTLRITETIPATLNGKVTKWNNRLRETGLSSCCKWLQTRLSVMLNNFEKYMKIQHNSNLDKVDVEKLIIISRMTVKHINAICNLYQSHYVGFQYYKCIIIVWNAFIKARRGKCFLQIILCRLSTMRGCSFGCCFVLTPVHQHWST